MKALLRSEKHCIVFGGFIGLGVVAASQTAVSGKELFSIPLMLAYFVILGLRFVLEMPAELSANWLFKAILDSEKHESAAVARKLIWTFLLLLVIIPCFAGYSYIWGLQTGLLHTAYVAVASTLLVEGLLLRFRKIPFTCSFPPFQDQLVPLFVACLVGYYVFIGIGAGVEGWMLANRARFVILPVVLAIAWWTRRRLREDILEMDSALIYQERVAAAVQRLNLLN